MEYLTVLLLFNAICPQDNSGLVPGEMIEDGSFPYFYCSFKRDASVTFTPPDGEVGYVMRKQR